MNTDFRALLIDIKKRGGKVLVVGLGISGVESAKFLAKAGIQTVAVEKEPETSYRQRSKFADRLPEIEKLGVSIHFGIDGEKVGAHTEGVELAVISPGVSLESAICGALKARSIKLVSELELGIELLGWPSIVVTGSNGKSTTVTLIHEILKSGGFKSVLCGNVGTPVIAGLAGEDFNSEKPAKSDGKSVLVVEASSYQLESCSVLKPKVGVLLNISDNHLERHGTLIRYFEIKSRLFQRQTIDDFAVINLDDNMVKGLARSVRSRVASFGLAANQDLSTHPWRSGIRYDRKSRLDTVDVAVAGVTESYDLSRSRLIGLHNRYNVAAAILAARVVGVDAAAVQRALEEFRPLEHRLELVAEIPGVVFINDSKSTTVAASVAAVSAVFEAFPERAVNLMIGGLSKAGSWQPLMALLEKNTSRLKPVVCFGRDANILANHCKANRIPAQQAATMNEGLTLAVNQSSAFQDNPKNEIVLLSPGCASFDEFTDFEDRGNVFKSILKDRFLSA